MRKISKLYYDKYKLNNLYSQSDYTTIVELEALQNYNNHLYIILHDNDDLISKILADDIVRINKEVEDFKIKFELND